MFILTDGKNYVMENPMRQGVYISTTSPIQAKEFTWRQARSLLQNKKSLCHGFVPIMQSIEIQE